MGSGVIDILRRECEEGHFARRRFGPWFAPGIEDEANLVHCFGLSYLAGLGFDSGLTALVEVPAPNRGAYAFAGCNVRSDVVWLAAATNAAAAAFEFERYAGRRDSAKLAEKARNLVLACHRWGTRELPTPVLVYWTQGLRNCPDHEALREIARRGFRTAAGEQVAGLQGEMAIVSIVCRVVQETGRWQLTAIKQR